MLPYDVWTKVQPDSSNDELRSLAASSGEELSTLWAARKRKMKSWERGVDKSRWKHR